MTPINLPLNSEMGLRAELNWSEVCLQQQPVAHISTSRRKWSDSVKATRSLKRLKCQKKRQASRLDVVEKINDWWDLKIHVLGAFRPKFGAVHPRSHQSGPMLIPGMNWLTRSLPPCSPLCTTSGSKDNPRPVLLGTQSKNVFAIFFSPQLPGVQKTCSGCLCWRTILIFSTAHSFWWFSFFCLPLKTCSSSDFDAVGDVNTTLNRHRWADDDDKERSDRRLRGRSERNAEGEGAEREWRDNKGGESWMKKGG